MTDLNEKFCELMDQYNSGVEPLENWSTEDLLDLKGVIEQELAERDRIAQNEYFDRQEMREDAQHDEFYQDDDDELFDECSDPLCPCHDNYGGTQ